MCIIYIITINFENDFIKRDREKSQKDFIFLEFALDHNKDKMDLSCVFI
jgi:hypothetical protein